MPRAATPPKTRPPIPLQKVEGDGWLIGKPDLIVKSKVHDIPTEGFVAYRYEPLNYVFPDDTWIDKVQILPDNPKVVHHCNLIMIPMFGDRAKNAIFVTGKVPGGIPTELRDGTAFRAPKAYIPLLQIHFTTNGHPEKVPDRSRLPLSGARRSRRSCTSSEFPTTTLRLPRAIPTIRSRRPGRPTATLSAPDSSRTCTSAGPT